MNLKNIVTATGAVLAAFLVSINAYRNSFQHMIQHRMIVAARPGVTRGREILQKHSKVEHPSILAASSISSGTSSKKILIIQITNAKLKER
jgi:hypothetical protein